MASDLTDGGIRSEEQHNERANIGRRDGKGARDFFPLFDLPPELWVKCCQFAVVESEPILINEPDDKAHAQACVAQPPITRTCRSIRSETISQFYKSNEFRFLDDGECQFIGLRDWVTAIWSSHWAVVKNCTVESMHDDVIEHMCNSVGIEHFAKVEFYQGAPIDDKTKVLKFVVKARKVEEIEGDGHDVKSSVAEESTGADSRTPI